MKTPVQIREATDHDSALIVCFQLKMALETENLQLDRAILQKGVQAILQDPVKGRYYLASVNNEVIGCMMNTYEWSDWRNGVFVWIQSVWVEPEWRGKGVFKMMYNFTRDLAFRNNTIMGIRLYVYHTNKSAQEVYRSLGMEDQSYRMFEWIKPT